jgi:hypothetical protein
MASNAVSLANFGSGIGTQGAVLQVDNTNNRLGVGTTNPQSTMQVGTGLTMDGFLGQIRTTGVITASSFVGDGAGLTGVASTDFIITGTAATFTGGVSVNELTSTGNVTIGGTLTYEDVTNIDSVGLVTARTGVRVTAGGLVVTAGVSTFESNISANGHIVGDTATNISGINSVTATTYYGDGGSLTGISVGLTTEAVTISSAVGTLNLTNAQDHKVTATGICTITVTGGTEADSHTVRVINSGIATVGFSTYFLFPSGAGPTLPTADGAISLISFTVNRVGAAGTQLLSGASVNYS